MRRKVDRLLDLLVLIGYSIEFPVKLAKRISGHEQYDRIVMYRALREGYAELLRREGKRQVIRSLRLTEKGFDYIAGRDPEALGIIYSRIGAAPPVYPSKESRILRLHAIAVGLVMARMAGAVISPLEKPPLLLSSRGLWYPQAEPEKVYYYAPFELRAAFDEVDDRVVSKTSRLIGSQKKTTPPPCVCCWPPGASLSIRSLRSSSGIAWRSRKGSATVQVPGSTTTLWHPTSSPTVSFCPMTVKGTGFSP